jgi:hypothetical protein
MDRKVFPIERKIHGGSGLDQGVFLAKGIQGA